jgi:hypothetical protein
VVDYLDGLTGEVDERLLACDVHRAEVRLPKEAVMRRD